MKTRRIQGPPRRFDRGLSVQYGHAGHNGRRIAFSHPRAAGAAATVDLSEPFEVAFQRLFAKRREKVRPGRWVLDANCTDDFVFTHFRSVWQ